MPRKFECIHFLSCGCCLPPTHINAAQNPGTGNGGCFFLFRLPWLNIHTISPRSIWSHWRSYLSFKKIGRRCGLLSSLVSAPLFFTFHGPFNFPPNSRRFRAPIGSSAPIFQNCSRFY